jgi:4-alpha-glucanotransferase
MTTEQGLPEEDRRDAPPPRDAGVLLHPTSLPGPHGIGDLGEVAGRWLDFLEAGRQTLWQILPLGPPGYGESPYAARSAFAGDMLLISLDRLVDEGLLDRSELVGAPDRVGRVDHGAVTAFKQPLLRRAFERFRSAGGERAVEIRRFREAAAYWLDDFCLFAALRETQGGAPWNEWPDALIRRDPAALDTACRENAEAIAFHRFAQFQFWRQWDDVKRSANARGIRIVGDIPIFVAHDSADVWAHQEVFRLDQHGNPTVVAGVPPDFFSATGQRWGNPLYGWDHLKQTGYRWWVERFRAVLRSVDIVRIDHFRGFEAYWEVPSDEETAVNGRWVRGPGKAFFDAMTASLGPLPVIVEDLGLITKRVDDLRLALGYPGMRVLQFAFGDDARNLYLPHNYDWNTVVYTGTHDNDTTEGWFAALPDADKARVATYAGRGPERISEKMIRLALASVARSAVVPLQDVLSLGNEARMNVPGMGTGNWDWRATPEQIDPAEATWLGEMTALFGRAPKELKSKEQSKSDPSPGPPSPALRAR